MKFCFDHAAKTKGQAASALNLFLAIGVVAVLGVFSVELSRYFLAKDQLKSNVESAALCCQTILASTGSATGSQNQSTAEQAGLSLFQQNTILGQSLSNASLVSLSPGEILPQFDVQGGEAQICFQFLDPVTKQPVAANSSGGTLIQATGAYSYVPVFGSFIGLANARFTFETSALSGIPKLDLVFVFDVSGAENLETPVTYVQRYWHNPVGIDYLIPPPIGGSPGSLPGSGPTGPFCITNAPNQGPNTNTPMSWDNGQYCPSPQINYSELSGSPTQLLTGSPQAYAAPPGNYPCGTSVWGYPKTITYNGNSMTIYLPVPEIYSNVSGVVPVSLAAYTSVDVASIIGGTPPSTYFPFSQSYTLPASLGGGTDYLVWVSNADYAANASTNVGNTGGLLHVYPPGSFTMGDGGDVEPIWRPPGFTMHNYAMQVVLENGSFGILYLGGGSAFCSNVPVDLASPTGPYPPTGPHPAVDATGASPVQSVLSGFSYGDYGYVFTHSVVNIDNNTPFQNASVAYNGNVYNFPTLGSLVEGSLGNLDSVANAQAAGLNLAALGLTQADLRSGYCQAYMQAASAVQSTQPMNTVSNAAISFMNQIATVSDAHFGCVTFNDYVGTDTSSTAPPGAANAPNNLSSSYPYPSMNVNPDGSIGPSISNTYLLPDILLDPNGNSTQATIASVLPSVHAWGNCNVAAALQSALYELDPQLSGTPSISHTRPSANKAIVLITTQTPNVGLNGSIGATALTDAKTVATSANSAGIPVFCISIAQSADQITSEDAAYNQIVAAAKNGSKYYRVNWTTPSATQTALTSTFANIARQLVRVVH